MMDFIINIWTDPVFSNLISTGVLYFLSLFPFSKIVCIYVDICKYKFIFILNKVHKFFKKNDIKFSKKEKHFLKQCDFNNINFI